MDRSAGILVTPCEVAVKRYVPSIRASLAIVLVKDYGLSIYRTAKLLHITPAAVSNYILGRRGKEYVDLILSDAELRRLVSELAERIISGDAGGNTIPEYLCRICSTLRRRVEGEEAAEECRFTPQRA